jgi:hypothetical protein
VALAVRSGVTWAGTLVVALIALTASAMLVAHAARAVTVSSAAEIAAVVGASIVGLGLTVVAARRDLGARAALTSGIVLVVLTRVAVAIVIDAPVDRDMMAYDRLAAAVLETGRLFDDRPMGFPYALAVGYAVLGRGALAGEVVNIVAAAVGGAALWVLVRRAAGARSASVALVLYALWPAGALMASARMSETLYTSMVLVAVAAVGDGTRRSSTIAAGAALAASQYVRATSVLLVPAFVIARYRPAPTRRHAFGALLAFVLAFGLVLLPVLYHNVKRHGEFTVSTSAYGGWSVWVGTNQEYGGLWNPEDWEALRHLTPGDIWQDSKAAGRLGIERITSDPLGFGALAVRKFGAMWAADDYGAVFALDRDAERIARHAWVILASQVLYAAVAILATAALIRSRRAPGDLSVLVAALTLTVTVLHIFVEVNDRYHAYLVPLYIAVAAPTFVGMVDEAVRRLPRAEAKRRREDAAGSV